MLEKFTRKIINYHSGKKQNSSFAPDHHLKNGIAVRQVSAKIESSIVMKQSEQLPKKSAKWVKYFRQKLNISDVSSYLLSDAFSQNAGLKNGYKIIYSSLFQKSLPTNTSDMLKPIKLDHVQKEAVSSTANEESVALPSVYSRTFFKSDVTPFVPELPVLKAIEEFAQNLPFPVDFKDIMFVCGQHLLNTTVSLIKFLIKLGAKPEHIFIVGKSYSNNSEVIAELKALGVSVQRTTAQLTLGGFNLAYTHDIHSMWENCYQALLTKNSQGQSIRGLIVVDDGGHVSAGMPEEVRRLQVDVVCIEQTSSGIPFTEMLPMPVIEVATTALKEWIEPPLVAAKCVEEVQKGLQRIRLKYPNTIIPHPSTIGIVGLGKIGYAMLEGLIKAGYQNFIIFDKDEKRCLAAEESLKNLNINIVSVNELLAVLSNSDIIIGCTGNNITAGAIDIFKTIKSPKVLVSCSSKDTEFLSLLQHIQKRHRDNAISPLEDIHYKNGFQAPIILLRGGTPIGFTNGLESVAARGIEPIRGLKAMACLQAYCQLMRGDTAPKSYMLNPEWQAFVAAQWLNSNPPSQYVNMVHSQLISVGDLKKKSGGLLYNMEQKPLSNSNHAKLELRAF